MSLGSFATSAAMRVSSVMTGSGCPKTDTYVEVLARESATSMRSSSPRV